MAQLLNMIRSKNVANAWSCESIDQSLTMTTIFRPLCRWETKYIKESDKRNKFLLRYVLLYKTKVQRNPIAFLVKKIYEFLETQEYSLNWLEETAVRWFLNEMKTNIPTKWERRGLGEGKKKVHQGPTFFAKRLHHSSRNRQDFLPATTMVLNQQSIYHQAFFIHDCRAHVDAIEIQ